MRCGHRERHGRRPCRGHSVPSRSPPVPYWPWISALSAVRLTARPWRPAVSRRL